MFEIDKAKFGAFVAQLRKEKGLMQKELAEKLYVSDKAVSKWERGLSIPDVAILVPLAEILGVTVTELLECRRLPKDEPMDSQQTEEIVKKAVIHSDRGSQFTSKSYKDLLEYFGVTQSMSLPASPRDNAVIESFFGHMKDEINLKKVKTFDEVVEIIDEYMYDYNNNRKQWNKNRMTPIEYRHFLVA